MLETTLNNYAKGLNIYGIISKTQVYGLLTASMLASLGLLYGDYSVILGAMMVSPMAQPLRNGAISLLQNKPKLLIPFFMGLLVMTLCAFMIGYIVVFLNQYLHWFDLPTDNMEKLADSVFLKVNFVIGCISGLVTPYASKIGSQSMSLGLMICVSVLPPVVNSGMMLRLSHIYDYDKELYLRKCLDSFLITVANWAGIFLCSIIGFGMLC